MRKWLLGIGVALTAILLAIPVALYIFAPKLKSYAQERGKALLQERFRSSIEFSSFDVSLYPSLRVTIFGLVMKHEGRTDIPPLFQISQITVDASLLDLFKDHPEIRSVVLSGLRINTPPHAPGGPGMVHGTDQDIAKKYPVVIDEIRADQAWLTLLRYKSDKPPNQFEIHRLVMRKFSFDQPAKFQAVLTNPKPRGEIYCDGDFGPWSAEDPRVTPVSGKYTFDNADFATLKGLQGTLSSTGKFSGPLDYLNVEGETDTPNFALRISGHPMDLRTQYKAIVDGTNGDTILNSVVAKFLHTTLYVHGSVVDYYPKVKGRTIALDAVSNDARIEDLLELAVKSDKPIMTGSARLNTKILIPEADTDLIQRLKLDGQFGIGKLHFTSSSVQGKVDALSRHGQGQPKDEGISDELSDLKGSFKMDAATIDFSHLTFGVEGASVSLAGTYAIDSGALDFRGKLRTEAKLSQMVTGWKSVVLKPFDHFFKGKDNSGAVIPIKIGGTREHPSFGPDFHDPNNKE